MAYPAGFKYTKDHEWVNVEGSVATIGITDYAQSELGDVVFVELPKVGTPEYREILQIEDPYNYRDRPRLNIPKFIINASGDQFFLPDNSQFYYDELPEEKHLRYVPNADHSLKNSDAWTTLLACYSSIVKGTKAPQFSWTMESDGSIRVKNQDKPGEVKLWKATNPEARDFRLAPGDSSNIPLSPCRNTPANLSLVYLPRAYGKC
jgi:PhoPQ-activated pathogenicity-related protein